jgi:hypothetical protein
MDGPVENPGLSVVALAFLACMAVMTFRLRRQDGPIPLLITTCYMPLGQEFVLAGLHFEFFRVLLFVGWIRILSRGEHRGFKLTPLDKLFIWWALATLVMGTLADPSTQRFINRGGQVYNALAAYFLFRCFIVDLSDLVRLVRFLAVMVAPLAICMIVEKFTSHNVFSAFGGVPAITREREGKLRCQGAFRHAILAGTYGATCFPLFVSLWFLGGDNKKRAIVGTVCSVVITVAATSSGALLALLCAIIGLGLWYLRDRMRLFRWGLVLVLAGMALMMRAPVWYVFARLSEVVGGTGWYRSYIIDAAMSHLNEWWLFGSTYTAHWAPGGEVMPGDPNNMDIINHYVLEGLGGGLAKLGLFLAMIITGFKVIGQLVREPTLLSVTERRFFWSAGVCLCTHCVSFFSVSYFDQIIVMWFWLLASLSMLSTVGQNATGACPNLTAEGEDLGGLAEPSGQA